jgi:hypothetical protein
MSTNYKQFDINDASTPAPWGQRETQWNEDIIDTLCVGTNIATKDTVNGHQHYRLVLQGDSSNSTSLIGYTTGQVVLYTDSNQVGSLRICRNVNDVDTAQLATDSTGNISLTSVFHNVTIAGNGLTNMTSAEGGVIQIDSGSINIQTNSGSACSILIEPATNGYVTIANLPTSSAGLTSGMLWINGSGGYVCIVTP